MNTSQRLSQRRISDKTVRDICKSTHWNASFSYSTASNWCHSRTIYRFHWRFFLTWEYFPPLCASNDKTYGKRSHKIHKGFCSDDRLPAWGPRRVGSALQLWTWTSVSREWLRPNCRPNLFRIRRLCHIVCSSQRLMRSFLRSRPGLQGWTFLLSSAPNWCLYNSGRPNRILPPPTILLKFECCSTRDSTSNLE